MNEALYGVLLFFLTAALANAANFPVSYTEPSGTGFQKTCVYSCQEVNKSSCSCKPKDLKACTDNQSGSTAATINVAWNIIIQPEDLPLCVNYAVVSRDSNGNESSLVYPAAGSFVFPVP